LALLLAGGCSGEPGFSTEDLLRVKLLFETKCSRCHPLDLPLRRAKTLEGWRRTVGAMRKRGVELTDEEAEKIARYLASIRGAYR
jgi:hypothetical protein